MMFEHLNDIFRAALERVDPYGMMIDHLRREGAELVVEAEGHHLRVDLDDYERILVLGAGKASARMARALEDILGPRLTGGLVVVKYGHAEPLSRIEVIEAGHPTPDARGVEAARRLAELARGADGKTLVLSLISGGGSALLPSPLEGLTLADKQGATAALLASGADIRAVNCVRKHLSGLKGGRLLSLLSPARSLNFILSDVVGDHLDAIASGLTVADASSFADALAVVDAHGLRDKLPAAALRVLIQGGEGRIAETLKAGDPAAALATNIIIGSNRAALLAARDKAGSLGYHAVALTSGWVGEARGAAKLLFAIARDIRDGEMLARRPACVLAGGETVVTLTGSGKGGRNQEMALAFLAELAQEPERGRGIHFLSAATDGGDGPTDAAGAFASAEVLEAAGRAGLSIAAALGANDSYTFFDQAGYLLRTGPTMTNVCDLQMVIIR